LFRAIFRLTREKKTGTFAHGIASGDPLHDAVILWTRITPANANGGPVKLYWEMALTSDFTDKEFGGTVTASAATNWTAKVDAAGLEAGQHYYYRFILGEDISPIGHTRTLPRGKIDSVRFAVVSCSNWQHGYFNAYDHIARQSGLDAVIHLGDYFYEYGSQGYEGTEMARLGHLHEPRHEVITLDDYRIRHAQYRTDPSLQAMSARFPLIAIWDDHESSNDSWQTGAENHSPATEGPWEDRKQAAMRKDDIQDEAGADKFKRDILGDPSREMYGQVQEDFIVGALTSSKEKGKTWRVIANQVIMGRLLTPDLAPYVDETAVAAIEKDWPSRS